MRKILLTTTESLQGWEIESYLQPVFSNVVIGAGFLSDFSASITDLFGGRSNSYEKKLQWVNENALQILKAKASEQGANVIIGLKVNIHQISGKNVQMFMVAAYGTAVIAKNNTKLRNVTSIKEIDKGTLNDKAELARLFAGFQNHEFRPTIAHIQLIIDNRASEFTPYILQMLKRISAIEFKDEASQNAEKLAFDYFSVIEPKDAILPLYSAIIAETDTIFIDTIRDVIKANDLLDYEKCLTLLSSDDIKKKQTGLSILSYDKTSYASEDIETIYKVIEKVKVSFPLIVTLGTKKVFLSSTEKEHWICGCQKSNSTTDSYCLNCGKDQYGFKVEDIKPATVKKNLEYKAKALEEAFNNKND